MHRWRDGGSRRIEASQKTASHSMSERSNSDETSAANPDEKPLNTPSKLHSEINNLLHKSVVIKMGRYIQSMNRLYLLAYYLQYTCITELIEYCFRAVHMFESY